MPKAFYHEQLVEIDGEKLLLAINFKAITATERFLDGRGYDSILDELQSPTCTIETTGAVVWGLLREHHPTVSMDETASLLFGANAAKVGLAVSDLMVAAFPAVEKAKGKNPRKPRGASKPS
jgi:hypothetical protein